MASKSIVMSPGGAAGQTTSRASATAVGIWRSSSDAVAFTALQAVEIEATSPNRSEPRPERFEVAQTVAPVRDGDGEVSEHHTRVVGVPRDAAVVHRHRHGSRQPGAISQFAQQRGPRVRDEIAPVGGYRDAVDRAATMHLQGGLLLGCLTVSEYSHSPS